MSVRTAAFAAIFLMAGASASAQQVPGEDVPRLGDSRQRLEQVLADLEQRLATEDLHEEDREALEREVSVVRARLTEGDFHVGEQVFLVVRNEQELTDTFTVAPGVVLPLPVGGDVDVSGLLRAELQPYLTEHLSRFIRNPDVRAQALVRISVLGEVGNPGFFVIPADVPVTDALTVAGGPTSKANLDNVRVERRGERVWEGDSFALAMSEGKTFDDLGIHPGDQFIVPEGRSTGDLLRILLISVPTTIFALTRIF